MSPRQPSYGRRHSYRAACEYELWTRIHARRLDSTHGDLVRDLIGRVALLELAPQVLSRALEAFPVAVLTLDALHLASAEFLRQQGQSIRLASYDDRILRAAAALEFALYPL